MKTIFRTIGMMVFWLSWPALYVYLRHTERTRVLLVAGDKVLLIRAWHGPGDWSLPGGGIRKNEDRAQAAVRELQEETAVAVNTETMQHIGKRNHKEYGLRFTCSYYLCHIDDVVKIRPRLPEVLEAAWVPMNELARYRLSPDARYALSAYDSSGTIRQGFSQK